MCELSDMSWAQLKTLQRQVNTEIWKREEEPPLTYQCWECSQVRGSKQVIHDHIDKEHGGAGVDDQRIIPIWK